MADRRHENSPSPSRETTFETPQPAALKEWNPQTKNAILTMLGVEGDVRAHEMSMCSHLKEQFRVQRPDAPLPALFVTKLNEHSGRKFALETKCRDCAIPPVWRVVPYPGQQTYGVPQYTLQRGDEPPIRPGYLTHAERKQVPGEVQAQLDRQNAAHAEAVKKYRIFSGPINFSEFFDTFGVPQRLDVSSNGNYIDLVYPNPYGIKNVPWQDVYLAKQFKKIPTGESRNINGTLQQGVQIEGIPGHTFFTDIAKVDTQDGEIPRIKDTLLFRSLPDEQKASIRTQLRAAIDPPRALAEAMWNHLFPRERNPYQTTKFDSLNTDIVTLQTPGDSFFVHKTVDVSHGSHESPDGKVYRGYTSKEQKKFLVVGGRMKSDSTKDNTELSPYEYLGGTEYLVEESEQSPQEIKGRLLEQKRKEREALFQNGISSVTNKWYGSLDDYLDAEEIPIWKETFIATYTEVQQEQIQKLLEEEQRRVEELTKEWNEYTQVNERITFLLTEMERLSALASDLFFSPQPPRYSGTHRKYGELYSLEELVDIQEEMEKFVTERATLLRDRGQINTLVDGASPPHSFEMSRDRDPVTGVDLDNKLHALRQAFGSQKKVEPTIIREERLTEADRIDPEESAFIIRTITDRVSLIESIVAVVPVGRDAGNQLKRTLLLKDIAVFKQFLSLTTISEKKDQKDLDKKFDSIKDKCKALVSDSSLDRQAKSNLELVQRVWMSIPRLIFELAPQLAVDFDLDPISEEVYPQVEERVKNRLKTEIVSYMQGDVSNMTEMNELISHVILDIGMEQ